MNRKSIIVKIYETNRDLTNYRKNINNVLVKNNVLLVDFQTQCFTDVKVMTIINGSLLKLSPLRMINQTDLSIQQDFTIKNKL